MIDTLQVESLQTMHDAEGGQVTTDADDHPLHTTQQCFINTSIAEGVLNSDNEQKLI